MNSHSLSFKKHEAKTGGSSLWAQGNSQHFSFWGNAGTGSQPAHKARCMCLFPVPCSVTLCRLLIDSGEKINNRGTNKLANVATQGLPVSFKTFSSSPLPQGVSYCFHHPLQPWTLFHTNLLKFSCAPKKKQHLVVFRKLKLLQGNKKSDKHMKKLQQFL